MVWRLWLAVLRESRIKDMVASGLAALRSAHGSRVLFKKWRRTCYLD